MNIGKLYQVKKFYWMIYPSKDVAAHAAVTATVAVDSAAAVARLFSARYSERVNCNVSYIFPNNIFVLLEQDGEFIRILSANGEVGWIYLTELYKNDIEEMNQ